MNSALDDLIRWLHKWPGGAPNEVWTAAGNASAQWLAIDDDIRLCAARYRAMRAMYVAEEGGTAQQFDEAVDDEVMKKQ